MWVVVIKEQDFEEPRAKGEINSSYWKKHKREM